MRSLSLFALVLQFVLSSAQAGEPQSCLAVRGNGQLVTSHWTSIAKYLETHPLFEGGVGGSSASVTLFLYESILQNPVIRDCGSCTELQKAQRASLLMKSLLTYAEVVKGEDEFVALTGAVKSIERILAAVGITKPEQVDALTVKDVTRLAPKLYVALRTDEIRGLLNREFLKMVSPKLNPMVALNQFKEAVRGLMSFGAFSVDDNRILYRPGLLDFRRVAERIARPANFYAARGDFFNQKGFNAFVERCAPLALGKSWSDLVAVQTQKGERTCASEVFGLMKAYRDGLKRRESITPTGERITRVANNRADEEVGKYLHILVSTAYLDPSEAKLFQDNRALFMKGDNAFDPKKPLGIYDRLVYGYWGKAEDSAKVSASRYDDLKSRKGRGLGAKKWREAIARSVSEPGLSRILDAPDGTATAAGWSDLAPVLAARTMGCKKVVYVTRSGEESNFAMGVARLLGIDEHQVARLKDLKDPTSSFAASIASADDVLCTNWDLFSGLNLQEVEKDAYHVAKQAPPYQQIYVGCGGTKPKPTTKEDAENNAKPAPRQEVAPRPGIRW